MIFESYDTLDLKREEFSDYGKDPSGRMLAVANEITERVNIFSTYDSTTDSLMVKILGRKGRLEDFFAGDEKKIELATLKLVDKACYGLMLDGAPHQINEKGLDEMSLKI